MIRLLVIEDNNNKLHQIKKFLYKEFHGIEIHDAISYTGGLRRIYEEKWDLILLDMTLPVYDVGVQDNGGDKKPTAGKEIMQRMHNRKVIIPTIIITQFDTFGENEVSIDDLNMYFNEQLSSIWKGTVNYEASVNRWQDDLKAAIYDVLEGKDD